MTHRASGIGSRPIRNLAGRHPGERQWETLDKNKERNEEMPKVVFVGVQIFHAVLPAHSKPRWRKIGPKMLNCRV
jgi:hypothetical protein